MSQRGILTDNTTVSGDIETLTGNSGGAVGPDTSHNISIVGGSGVTVTGDPGTNTLTIDAATIIDYRNVNSSPYVVAATDEYLSIDTTSARTLQFPNSTTSGRIFTVKDRTGNAAANNITVTTVGGIVTIDGAASVAINGNFNSINLIFNGSNYEIW